MHCPNCATALRERLRPAWWLGPLSGVVNVLAEHVHGTVPTVRGGPDMRRPMRCWNQCQVCAALYEALPCGAPERQRRRRLERYGQLTLEAAAC